jgi:hypothetical protein
MTLMRRLTCAMDTPNTAGPIWRMTRRTPSSRKPTRKRGRRPSRSRKGTWNASCAAPPTNTAQASAVTGGSNHGASHSAKAMKETLSRTGVKAGTQNRLQVLSTPPASAVKEMKKI